MCKSMRKVSEETKPADTLVTDSQPPELWENKFLFFKSPCLWYFVTAAWNNTGLFCVSSTSHPLEHVVLVARGQDKPRRYMESLCSQHLLSILAAKANPIPSPVSVQQGKKQTPLVTALQHHMVKGMHVKSHSRKEWRAGNNIHLPKILHLII